VPLPDPCHKHTLVSSIFTRRTVFVGGFLDTTKLYQFHTAKASPRTHESTEKFMFFAIPLPFPVPKKGPYIDPKNGVTDMKSKSPKTAYRLIFADRW